MNAVNAFFQNHFLNAQALWWLAGLAPLIIVLYFLKLKREELTVASTLLWMQSIQDLRVNAPFQRLRRNLLLLIQLLILLLAVGALSRPLFEGKEKAGKKTILLLDTSASMAAKDMDGTRLAAAKKQAKELVANMVEGDRMAIIRFAKGASVVASMTGNVGVLNRAIDRLEADATETNLREALTIALSLAGAAGKQTGMQAEIHLFSDGKYSDALDVANLRGEITYHPMGKSSRNVAVTALDVGYSSELEGAGEVFYSIENFDLVDNHVTIEFHFNGKLIGAAEKTVQPGERLSGLAPSTGEQEGLLKLEIESKDSLALDDVGYAVIRKPGRVKVLLVGPGDYFLNRALAAAGAETKRKSLSSYTTADARKADLVIFDGEAPEKPGKGAFIYHNCLPHLEGLVPTGLAEGPLILDYDRTHPLMRFFSLAEVFVLKMQQVQAPNWMKVLAQTTHGPLILLADQPDFRALVLPFHISQSSNISAQGTFPIFVLNCLRWLPVSQKNMSRQLITGETIVIGSRQGKAAKITAPGGKVYRVQPVRGRILFAETKRPGIYKVEVPGQKTETFAANLLRPVESNIAPKAQFKLKGADVIEEKGVRKSNREIWHWLTLAAFFLLLGEWYIYNARVYL